MKYFIVLSVFILVGCNSKFSITSTNSNNSIKPSKIPDWVSVITPEFGLFSRGLGGSSHNDNAKILISALNASASQPEVLDIFFNYVEDLDFTQAPKESYLRASGSLYLAGAKQPDVFEDLINKFPVTISDSTNISKLEEQGKVLSLGGLFDSIVRQSEMSTTFKETARDLFQVEAPYDYSSTHEVQFSRGIAIGDLFKAFVRQPESGVVEYAETILPDSHNFSTQGITTVGKGYAIASMIEAIGRQPELKNSLVSLYESFFSEKKINGADLYSTFAKSLIVGSYIRTIASNSEVKSSLDEILTSLIVASQLHTFSSFSCYSRAVVISKLLESITANSEMKELLVSFANEWIGDHRMQAKSSECSQAKALAISKLIESVTRKPEMSEELISVAKQYIGESNSYDKQILQMSGASYFIISSLITSFGRQPSAINSLISIVRNFLGEIKCRSSDLI